MNHIFRQLWRIRRLIIVWLLLSGIAAIYWLREHAGLETVDDYNRLAQAAIRDVLIGSAIAFAFILLFLFVKRIRNHSRQRLPSTFENKPWIFDRQFVELTLQVTKILPDNWDESLKRRSNHILRLLTKDPETIYRFRHLRFFATSKSLQKGEQILIIHNIDAAPIELRVGDWVTLCGEYLHQRVRRKTMFGSRLSVYGRLHHTHEPKGFLRILDKHQTSAQSITHRIT